MASQSPRCRSSTTISHLDRLAETVERLARIVADNSQELARVQQEQRTQFTRLAQLQAELDSLKSHRRRTLTHV